MVTPDLASQNSTDALEKPPLVITERDIVFNCPTCQGELVIDQAGAEMEVTCSHCGQPLIVPEYHPPAAAVAPLPTDQAPVAATSAAPAPVATASAVRTELPPAATQTPVPARTFDHAGMTPEQLSKRFEELKHQLKENRSQDTEMRGHVNRATIELHRLQMRLKKLQDRQADIQAEVATLQTQLGPDESTVLPG